jgi:hypothetical protein
MARPSTKFGGIQVDGLNETIRALGKVDKRLKAEAVDTMRDGAKRVQADAQSRIGAGGYRMKRNRGMIGRSATSTGAGIKLRASKYPWAYSAEYGEAGASVWGRGYPQRLYDQRTAAPLNLPTSSDMSQNTGGYMIQPAIRKHLPALRLEAGRAITKLVTRSMKSSGVKSKAGR